MRIGFLKIVAIIGLALVFNACGSRIDESVQDNIQESYSQNDEENAEVYQQQEGDPIDILIESKIDSAGILILTEYEFSKDIISRAIERRINFTLTYLNDRDLTIKEIENIMKEKKESYSIVNDMTTKDLVGNTVEGGSFGALGGGIIAGALSGGLSGALAGSVVLGPGNMAVAAVGATLGLLYSLKDSIKNILFKPNWKILKSSKEDLLEIKFVKDQNQ